MFIVKVVDVEFSVTVDIYYELFESRLTEGKTELVWKFIGGWSKTEPHVTIDQRNVKPKLFDIGHLTWTRVTMNQMEALTGLRWPAAEDKLREMIGGAA